MPGQLEKTFEYIEIGKIVNIDYTKGSCDLASHDITTGERKTIPYPLPYAGKGWGVLVGPEEGSTVAIGHDKTNRPWILAYRPIPGYFNKDIEGIPFIGVNDFPYRRPESGEIVLQSKANSAVELNKDGDIRIETVDGTYIEINKDLETIIQESVDALTISEAGTFKAGLIRRDIREEQDKQNDALFGNTFDVNTAQLLFSDIIGKNPEYDQGQGIPKGLYDPTFLTGIEVAAKNPSLTEAYFQLAEYADSNVGLDQVQLTDAEKSVGKMEVNRLMDIKTGTVVNDLGKILRFDYSFGKGTQGHGKIYKASTDFFFNVKNTLKSPQVSQGSEKFVSQLAKINAAILFQLLMHTKGADNKGILESKTFRGALWSLLVDKEGLTKLEIPAATNLGDEKGEPGRAGKSMLANLNGSLTLALGKEKSEDTSINNVLNSDVTHSTKGRKDRSLTLDAEGNVELIVGADSDKKQSITLAADGSIEAKIGKDTINEQSIKITTEGGIFITVKAADKNKDAINITVTGNVTQKIDGDTKTTVTGDTEIKTSGKCTITSTGDTDIKATGKCNVDGSLVNLGKNIASQLVNNLPACLVTGAPHAIGNTNVKV